MKKFKKMAIVLAIVSLAFIFSTLLIGCTDKNGPNSPIGNPLPVLKTAAILDISRTSATIKVEIIEMSSDFIESGIMIGNKKVKLDPVSSKNFSISATNLTTNTSYVAKAYAVVKEGTAYGNELTFKTKGALEKIKDIDGNEYDIVTIGTQTWTAKDWKSTHYRNGNEIPNVYDDNSWHSAEYGALCWYDNQKNVGSVLYNWYAAIDQRGLAPIGWHVSTREDWDKLDMYLINAGFLDGNVLKETGKLHWFGDNEFATNSTDFTAIATGYRSINGIFSKGGLEAWYMMLEPNRSDYYCKLSYDSQSIFLYFNMMTKKGTAVRLVKN